MTQEFIKKADNFSEHFAEWASFGPSSVDKNIMNILFVSNRVRPVVRNLQNAEENGTKELTLGAGIEMTHECSIMMNLKQVKAFHAALGRAIETVESKLNDEK